MRILRSLVFFLYCVVLPSLGFSQFEPAPVTRSSTTVTIDGKEYFQHTVLPGQTLFGISQAYGVTVNELVAANSHLPELPGNLRSGMVLRIPSVQHGQVRPVTPDAAPRAAGRHPATHTQNGRTVQILRQEFPADTVINHTVTRGETLFGISRHYQVSQEDILLLNPIVRQGLRPRQVIQIPIQRPQIVEYFQYTVQTGETTSGLAAHFGIPIDELLGINPEIQSSDPVEGSKIRIPARASGVAFPPVQERLGEPLFQQTSAADHAYCSDPRLKPSYNVAVLVPLYLDQFQPEAGPINPAHVSFSFIQFYQGILIALDSIRHNGVSIQLHTYDVSRDLAAVRRILNQPEFQNMDLIIGPFFPEPLQIVAEFGQRNGIAVVSPFFNDLAILRIYPNLIQITPSMQTQLESIAEYIARNYSDQNIILVHNNQPEAIDIINNFRRRLNLDLYRARTGQDRSFNGFTEEFLEKHGLVGSGRLHQNDNPVPSSEGIRDSNGLFHEVVYRSGGIAAIQNRLDPNRKNLVVTLIGGEAFVSNYLRQLDLLRRKFNIVVMGTPQWQEYHSINLRLYESLGVYNFSFDFAEFRDEHIRNFVAKFRNTFKTEPNFDAFNGVRTGYFFFDALGRFGKEFLRCMDHLNSPGYTNSFHFRRLPGEGWENIKFVLFQQVGFRQLDVTRQVVNSMDIRATGFEN